MVRASASEYALVRDWVRVTYTETLTANPNEKLDFLIRSYHVIETVFRQYLARAGEHFNHNHVMGVISVQKYIDSGRFQLSGAFLKNLEHRL